MKAIDVHPGDVDVGAPVHDPVREHATHSAAVMMPIELRPAQTQ
jgi:hypothetical protein